MDLFTQWGRSYIKTSRNSSFPHETKWPTMNLDRRCEQTSHWWEHTETVSKHMKSVSHDEPLRKYKLEIQWNVTVNSLRWLRFKNNTESFTSYWSNCQWSSHAENSGSENPDVLTSGSGHCIQDVYPIDIKICMHIKYVYIMRKWAVSKVTHIDT